MAGWSYGLVSNTAMTATGCVKTLRFPYALDTGRFAIASSPVDRFYSLTLTYRTTMPYADLVLQPVDSQFSPCTIKLNRTDPIDRRQPDVFTYAASPVTVTVTASECGYAAGSAFWNFQFYISYGDDDSDLINVFELLIGKREVVGGPRRQDRGSRGLSPMWANSHTPLAVDRQAAVLCSMPGVV